MEALKTDPGPLSVQAGSPNQVNTRESVANLGAQFVPQTLRYLGVPEDLVLDAAQDVLVVALRRLGDFEGRSTLKTWLYGICIRVAQEQRRKVRSRREVLVDALPEVTSAAEQESAVQKAEWRRQLNTVLDTLNQEQREAFVLFEIQRLSMKEVAEALGCPLKTAYFRHQAARDRVVEAFKRRAGEGER